VREREEKRMRQCERVRNNVKFLGKSMAEMKKIAFGKLLTKSFGPDAAS